MNAGVETAPPARALLEGAIDYAGLFPPAGLGMAAAVENYRRYLASPERWALGRFVCPVGRLDELAAVRGVEPEGEAWPVAAVARGEPEAEASAIALWNQLQAGRLRVDAVEASATAPEAVAARVAASTGLMCYCEIDPAVPGFHATAAAVRAAGACAKLRTGGVVPAAIPPAARVAAFLEACQRLDLPFKATAGLHHAIRGRYALTYEPDAPTAVMHGFLNVSLAAAFLQAGGPIEAARHILERDNAAGLRFEDRQIVWQGTRWSLEQIQAGRRFFIGFGSCSFEEPLACLSTI